LWFSVIALPNSKRSNDRYEPKPLTGFEEKKMNKLYSFILTLTRDEKAQDMVEYALLAGFIAVAAGAVLPGISTSISQIFSKMASITTAAATK
jgi:pilus assembly protein Flp/PilA